MGDDRSGEDAVAAAAAAVAAVLGTRGDPLGIAKALPVRFESSPSRWW